MNAAGKRPIAAIPITSPFRLIAKRKSFSLTDVPKQSEREAIPSEFDKNSNRLPDFPGRRFFEHFLGSAMRNDLNRDTLEAVSTFSHRFGVQAKGFALLKPINPLKRV